jgi:hypothetical protein
MNVEHFGFLSWVFRKGESHEQDGETLARVLPARIDPASGDPAMAFGSSIRLARADSPGTFGGDAATQWQAQRPPTPRAELPAREKTQRRMPSFSMMLL